MADNGDNWLIDFSDPPATQQPAQSSSSDVWATPETQRAQEVFDPFAGLPFAEFQDTNAKGSFFLMNRFLIRLRR
tara:strand:- start:138 stop:362 length:225 start_codon:yes stop_codon:yes gene_type:complete